MCLKTQSVKKMLKSLGSKLLLKAEEQERPPSFRLPSYEGRTANRIYLPKSTRSELCIFLLPVSFLNTLSLLKRLHCPSNVSFIFQIKFDSILCFSFETDPKATTIELLYQNFTSPHLLFTTVFFGCISASISNKFPKNS